MKISTLSGFLVLSFVTVIVLCSNTELEPRKFKLKKIVLDAGHGGKDPGCHGKKNHEADIALAVALNLGRIINENLPDVKVIYTRDKDHFVELHDRAGIANKNNADLFISIHCNSGPKEVQGTEVYTMGLHTSEGNLDVAKRENAVILQETDYKKKYDGFDPNSPLAHILFANYQNAHIASSIKLASYIDDEFKTKIGRNSRGVKQAGFLVLWKTTMPSLLIETGYLTNKQEEQFLANKENQVFMASGIYRAVKKFKESLEGQN
jgi:N-acetylmuramoyl-L-alanine amidase